MAVEAGARAPQHEQRGWLVLRGVLLLWCLGVALIVGVSVAGDGAPQDAGWALDQLYGDASAGELTSPVLIDDDRDVVMWSRGGQRRAAPLGDTSPSDVTRRVQEVDPSATYEVRTGAEGWFVTLAGQRVTGVAAAYVAVGVLAAFWLLVAGPQPWRATRWSWFWLAGVPGGGLAFLLLAGPTPGIRPHDPWRPRLTGGKAFLLSIGLGILLDPLLGLLLQALGRL